MVDVPMDNPAITARTAKFCLTEIMGHVFGLGSRLPRPSTEARQLMPKILPATQEMRNIGMVWRTSTDASHSWRTISPMCSPRTARRTQKPVPDDQERLGGFVVARAVRRGKHGWHVGQTAHRV
jgi:hypothetical protein